jgi:DNA adenine methylase
MSTLRQVWVSGRNVITAYIRSYITVSVRQEAIQQELPPISRRQQKKNELVQPFLKWAGGKRQLLPVIREHLPKQFKKYFEPFVGAGAVLFDLKPKKAQINDANAELVNCYEVIKTEPEALIEDINRHQVTSEYYYWLRNLDRDSSFTKLTKVERASRIIFLNKTCYNGLFRVNRQGQFNVPYGDYKNPTIIVEVVIRAVSSYLNDNDIEISSTDFAVAVSAARKGDFVYLDPPYDPLTDTASFTGYNLNKFDKAEQHRLKAVFDELTQRQCHVLLSNSATKFISELYKSYKVIPVEASRNINSVGAGRGKIHELLISNY